MRAAYTFSDFTYTHIRSLFGDFSDQVMPNSPRHQAYADAEYVAASAARSGAARVAYEAGSTDGLRSGCFGCRDVSQVR